MMNLMNMENIQSDAFNPESSPIVSVLNISKRFKKLRVLQDVNLSISKGEIIAIIGPSGAGKSTLLRCINQLEEIDDGDILLEGRSIVKNKKSINEMRQEIGMVFQHFNLFQNLNVYDNITIGPKKLKKKSPEELDQICDTFLSRVGLKNKKYAYPSQLSGGEKQRIAIARALAMEPEVLLFDEPTSALDPEMVGEVLQVIKELADSGMTMIIVTHEMGFAREIADEIVFMEMGKILEVDTPDHLFNCSSNKRINSFLAKVLR